MCNIYEITSEIIKKMRDSLEELNKLVEKLKPEDGLEKTKKREIEQTKSNIQKKLVLIKSDIETGELAGIIGKIARERDYLTIRLNSFIELLTVIETKLLGELKGQCSEVIEQLNKDKEIYINILLTKSKKFNYLPPVLEEFEYIFTRLNGLDLENFTMSKENREKYKEIFKAGKKYFTPLTIYRAFKNDMLNELRNNIDDKIKPVMEKLIDHFSETGSSPNKDIYDRLKDYELSVIYNVENLILYSQFKEAYETFMDAVNIIKPINEKLGKELQSIIDEEKNMAMLVTFFTVFLKLIGIAEG